MTDNKCWVRSCNENSEEHCWDRRWLKSNSSVSPSSSWANNKANGGMARGQNFFIAATKVFWGVRASLNHSTSSLILLLSVVFRTATPVCAKDWNVPASSSSLSFERTVALMAAIFPHKLKTKGLYTPEYIKFMQICCVLKIFFGPTCSLCSCSYLPDRFIFWDHAQFFQFSWFVTSEQMI